MLEGGALMARKCTGVDARFGVTSAPGAFLSKLRRRILDAMDKQTCALAQDRKQEMISPHLEENMWHQKM
jgi:hypothetical protein